MALDQNAGKKKAVGLARNLFPNVAAEAVTPTPTTTIAEALAVTSSPVVTTPVITATPVISSPIATEKPAPQFTGATYVTTAKNQNRIKKVSFMIDPALEKRFRVARLKAGFEKLEDAYNEALKKFCELSEQGKIDNF